LIWPSASNPATVNLSAYSPSKYPSARVIGNDLSAIQPSWVPPNLEFVVDDFEREWMYKPDYFDFIHARTIAGYVSKPSMTRTPNSDPATVVFRVGLSS
jgi:hypothetical protein